MASGMNDTDRALLANVEACLRDAKLGASQNASMTQLMWAQHLLSTLLRQMQDS